MVIERFLPALLAFLLLATQAFPQSAPAAASSPEDLPAALEQHAKTREALKARTAEGQAALLKWYHAALDAVKQNATTKGQLDDVLAVEAERERAGRELTPEEAGKLPPVLRSIRTQYDQARAQQLAQEKTSLAAALRVHLAALEGLEKRLTQKSDVPNAVLARKERTAADEELKSLLGPVPLGNPAAPASPKAATPAARSVGASTEPVTVASKVLVGQGTSGVKDAGPGTISFVPPDQPKGSGAVGVLLQNDPAAGSKGSTWTVSVATRGGTFLQFVHPFEGGHVIVQLTPQGVVPCRVKTWREQPWSSAGDAAFFQRTADFAGVFPIPYITGKPIAKIIFSSQLDPKGNYTLSANGKVVATGSFAAAAHRTLYVSRTPLTLTKAFQGETLPLQWKPGSAALLFAGTVPGSGSALTGEDIVFEAKGP